MILYKKRKNGGKKSFLQRGVFQEPINRVVGGLPVLSFYGFREMLLRNDRQTDGHG